MHHQYHNKNIIPHKDEVWGLVVVPGKKYGVGLHPSLQIGDDVGLLNREKVQLEAMVGQQLSGLTPSRRLTASRQHYIHFNLPQTYQQLIGVGITDDHSMGYGSISGFRASIASAFFWYYLGGEEQTHLRLLPFCVMETNSFYENNIFVL